MPIARPLIVGWHGHCGGRYALTDPAPFVRCEEEGMVFPDRPTERSTKLVLVELGLGTAVGREAIGVRVQYLVAEELVNVPVNLVGAGLGHNVYHGTGVAAVFRVERVG